MKQPVRKQPNTAHGAFLGLSVYDVAAQDRDGAQSPRYAESVDAGVTPFCAWCHGSHHVTACPRGPRLSVGSVVAFALAAMVKPARGWA